MPLIHRVAGRPNKRASRWPLPRSACAEAATIKSVERTIEAHRYTVTPKEFCRRWHIFYTWIREVGTAQRALALLRDFGLREARNPQRARVGFEGIKVNARNVAFWRDGDRLVPLQVMAALPVLNEALRQPDPFPRQSAESLRELDGQRFRELRLDRGLTQQDAAFLLHKFHPAPPSNYERGLTEVPRGMLSALEKLPLSAGADLKARRTKMWADYHAHVAEWESSRKRTFKAKPRATTIPAIQYGTRENMPIWARWTLRSAVRSRPEIESKPVQWYSHPKGSEIVLMYDEDHLVPDYAKPGQVQILKMPDEAAEALVALLQKAPPLPPSDAVQAVFTALGLTKALKLLKRP